MAQTGQKDLLARLADAGEDAIQRLASSTPGADRLLGVVNTMRDQLDALNKRVRGMDELERRVVKLERELAKLTAGVSSRTTRKSTASARKTTARKTGGARKSATTTSSRSRSTRKR